MSQSHVDLIDAVDAEITQYRADFAAAQDFNFAVAYQDALVDLVANVTEQATRNADAKMKGIEAHTELLNMKGKGGQLNRTVYQLKKAKEREEKRREAKQAEEEREEEGNANGEN